MQVNFNPQQNRQNFGMAIRANEKAIHRVSEYITECPGTLFNLNKLITSQEHKKPDIFLSTDEYGNLIAKIGNNFELKESSLLNPIKLIQNAANIIDDKETKKVWDKIYKLGLDEAINQVVNRLK